MHRKLTFACLAVGLLAACANAPAPAEPVQWRPAFVAKREFVEVARIMEPVAERECLRRTQDVNCDFKIVLDTRRRMAANAFQTFDDEMRPVIVFNIRLLREAVNADELAFVMGHEAAHHIEGHIVRHRQNAEKGANLLEGLAIRRGDTAPDGQRARELGTQVGPRVFSREYELEADALGTVLTQGAGFDPVRGAQFFNRIPDPSSLFLSTHPPNDVRIETVKRVASEL